MMIVLEHRKIIHILLNYVSKLTSPLTVHFFMAFTAEPELPSTKELHVEEATWLMAVWSTELMTMVFSTKAAEGHS